MTIYLDVIWALNFLFDTLLLYLTAIILKRGIKYRRLILGGLIGSVIILLSVTPLNDYSSHPLVKLFFSVLMVLAAFGFKRLKDFFRALMTLYFTTFLIGGALIGVHYFIQYDVRLSPNLVMGSYGDPVSWLFVLLGFPLAWHFSKTSLERIEMTKIRYDQIIKVSIKLGETELNIKGLIDSGNQLYDPISKMPVMFVSLKNYEFDIPESIKKLAEEAESIILGAGMVCEEWERKIRIIPYKVVGTDHQLIIAIKPDEMIIEKDEESLLVEKGLVSFTMQSFSSDDAFQCIVHPKMLTGTTKKMKTSVRVS